jgi:hypothetical protein
MSRNGPSGLGFDDILIIGKKWFYTHCYSYELKKANSLSLPIDKHYGLSLAY